jgi:D-alanine-D-alanine ligase-like ATP-grasp enzyme
MKILGVADHALRVMRIPDLCRVDLRLGEDGKAYVIELNPLTSLRENSGFSASARGAGLEYGEMLQLIVKSAAQRYHLTL